VKVGTESVAWGKSVGLDPVANTLCPQSSAAVCDDPQMISNPPVLSLKLISVQPPNRCPFRTNSKGAATPPPVWPRQLSATFRSTKLPAGVASPILKRPLHLLNFVIAAADQCGPAKDVPLPSAKKA
jgi:hypothetical protein